MIGERSRAARRLPGILCQGPIAVHRMMNRTSNRMANCDFASDHFCQPQKGRKVARSGERDHLRVQIRFSFEADARKLGQCHVPINDFNAVGKTAIGLEQVRIAFIAA